MSHVDSFTDTVLTEFTCRCHNLREVYLNNCSGITDSGVSRLQNLTRMALCFNGNVTDMAIDSLLYQCGGLEYAEIIGCSKVTESGLVRLRERVTLVEAF